MTNVFTYILLLTGALQLVCGKYHDIKTKSGWVRGESIGTTSGTNRTLYAWKSIPYAEPPVGNLRFEPPVPKAPWKGVLDVRPNLNACVQGSDKVTGEEDCLHLQILTTQKPGGDKKLPVLVWIHGGFWWVGRVAFDVAGVDSLLNQDIIVVGINYRLGPFGFMTTEDLVLPGNGGLKDQILGLKWVQENIEYFGGDPKKVTLVGQSAGSASVGYILQYPGAKGLFSKVIMMSGNPLCLFSKAQAGIELAQQTGRNLKLHFKSSLDLVQQLKKADPAKLQMAAMSARNSFLLGENPRDGLIFVPSTEPNHEGAVVTEKSHELLAAGNFTHVPILAGFTSFELDFQHLPLLFKAYLLKYDVDLLLLVPSSMNAGLLGKARAALRIKSRYFGLSTVSGSAVKTSLFVSDDQFMRPITKAIELYSARVPVYFYRFSYVGRLGGNNNTDRIGPSHAEDLAYLGEYPYEGTSEDYLTKRRMVKMWTNFIKMGNPTPDDDELLDNLVWPANNGSKPLKCLDINKNLRVVDSPDEKNSAFWDDLFRKFGHPPYDTY